MSPCTTASPLSHNKPITIVEDWGIKTSQARIIFFSLTKYNTNNSHILTRKKFVQY